MLIRFTSEIALVKNCSFCPSQNSYLVHSFFHNIHFFLHTKKSSFLLYNITRDYSQKRKMKNQKQKLIIKPIKKNYKKEHQSIIEILLKNKK